MKGKNMRKLVTILLTVLTLTLISAPSFAAVSKTPPPEAEWGAGTRAPAPTPAPDNEPTGSNFTSCSAFGRWNQKCAACSTDDGNVGTCGYVAYTAVCYCDAKCLPHGICIWSQN
jgi:hypothetical protein